MVTADSVKEKLQTVIAKANGTTGRDDADVNAAVDALIAGYGQSEGQAPEMMAVRTVTIENVLGNGANSLHTLLTADDFVKTHCADDGFAVLMVPTTPITGDAGYLVHCIYHGNINLGASGVPRYGFVYASTSATAIVMLNMSTKIMDKTYNVALRAHANGNLETYIANNRKLNSGNYMLIMTCTT